MFWEILWILVCRQHSGFVLWQLIDLVRFMITITHWCRVGSVSRFSPNANFWKKMPKKIFKLIYFETSFDCYEPIWSIEREHKIGNLNIFWDKETLLDSSHKSRTFNFSDIYMHSQHGNNIIVGSQYYLYPKANILSNIWPQLQN